MVGADATVSGPDYVCSAQYQTYYCFIHTSRDSDYFWDGAWVFWMFRQSPRWHLLELSKNPISGSYLCRLRSSSISRPPFSKMASFGLGGQSKNPNSGLIFVQIKVVIHPARLSQRWHLLDYLRIPAPGSYLCR